MLTRFVAVSAIVGCLSASPQVATAQEDEDARALYLLGEGAFEHGRFRAALDYFQQAYSHSGRAQLLYNIAQAADRLREDRLALQSFQRYLELLPDASNRDVVEARIIILRESIAADERRAAESVVAVQSAAAEEEATEEDAADVEAPTVTPVVAAAERSGSSSGEPVTGPNVGAMVAGSAGAAVAISGVVVMAMGLHDYQSVVNAPDGATWRAYADAHDRSASRTTVGGIIMGLGVAGCVTGLVLRSQGSDDGDRVAFQFEVLPNGLRIRGTF